MAIVVSDRRARLQESPLRHLDPFLFGAPAVLGRTFTAEEDRPRGGTACQRARLDSGRGTIRDRFEGPNASAGKGVGGIP